MSILKDSAFDRVELCKWLRTGNVESISICERCREVRKIGDLITKPIPNLLQFELTGTLKDQKLRSLYDPRNLIPKF